MQDELTFVWSSYDQAVLWEKSSYLHKIYNL